MAGWNPISHVGFFGSDRAFPELGVLWAQWEGWDCSAKLRALQGRVIERVAQTA